MRPVNAWIIRMETPASRGVPGPGEMTRWLGSSANASSTLIASLRCTSTEAPNTAGQDQDLTLEISSGSRTAAIPASSLHRLLYPDVVFGAGKIVMQSLRLPIRHLAGLGIDPRDLRSITFVFDRRATGVVYVGDVQLSN